MTQRTAVSRTQTALQTSELKIWQGLAWGMTLQELYLPQVQPPASPAAEL